MHIIYYIAQYFLILLYASKSEIVNNNNNNNTNNNNNNNDNVNKNQVISLEKGFSRLYLKVFKLSAFFNVSGIWFQNEEQGFLTSVCILKRFKC